MTGGHGRLQPTEGWAHFLGLAVLAALLIGFAGPPWMAAIAVAGLALGLSLHVPSLLTPDWVRVTPNRDSLEDEGTMILDCLVPREMPRKRPRRG